MAETVKVIIRCRPINKLENEKHCQTTVRIHDASVEIWDPDESPSYAKQFSFDSAYDQKSSTETIYNEICYPLIESVIEGYNSTIFVYGQTGCGKSYTMGGDITSTPPNKGIISRSFDHIFEAISVTSNAKYLAMVSYLEIYNEQIRDLLVPANKSCVVPTLKEVPHEGVIVTGLSSHPVHNALECEELLQIGTRNRITEATLMNQNSSRSHSIFTINIEQISKNGDVEIIKKGKLNLVDLAGSERQTKTGAVGERLKEATKINLSLSALGNVISALVDGKAKHIPYRDSKLTRLLQDSLGGNTRTLMIACISPSSRDYYETLSTLRYANRAKNICNKPRINEDPKDAMLRKYKEEIDRLKEILENKKNHEVHGDRNDVEINDNYGSKPFDATRDKLIEDYQREMEKLKNLHDNEKIEKENIMKQIENIKNDYEQNIRKLNEEILEKNKRGRDDAPEEEILQRIETLKNLMIGGEKADDHELSEKRKRKKIAAEKRLNAIAHVMKKLEMNEDREILQNQYEDISQELNAKTEILKKYRQKLKLLEKEITDLQTEFQTEREDYLETIRRQDKCIQLLNQISEKLVKTLKPNCNYRNLEIIKKQAIWLDDLQKYKLPDITTPVTKFPPTGRSRNNRSPPSNSDSGSNLSSPQTQNTEGKNDIIENYFKPKRAAELLSESSKIDACSVFNTWREFAKNRQTMEDILNRNNTSRNGTSPNLWISGNGTASPFTTISRRKNYKLDALSLTDVNKNYS